MPLSLPDRGRSSEDRWMRFNLFTEKFLKPFNLDCYASFIYMTLYFYYGDRNLQKIKMDATSILENTLLTHSLCSLLQRNSILFVYFLQRPALKIQWFTVKSITNYKNWNQNKPLNRRCCTFHLKFLIKTNVLSTSIFLTGIKFLIGVEFTIPFKSLDKFPFINEINFLPFINWDQFLSIYKLRYIIS